MSGRMSSSLWRTTSWSELILDAVTICILQGPYSKNGLSFSGLRSSSKGWIFCGLTSRACGLTCTRTYLRHQRSHQWPAGTSVDEWYCLLRLWVAHDICASCTMTVWLLYVNWEKLTSSSLSLQSDCFILNWFIFFSLSAHVLKHSAVKYGIGRKHWIAKYDCMLHFLNIFSLLSVLWRQPGSWGVTIRMLIIWNMSVVSFFRCCLVLFVPYCFIEDCCQIRDCKKVNFWS